MLVSIAVRSVQLGHNVVGAVVKLLTPTVKLASDADCTTYWAETMAGHTTCKIKPYSERTFLSEDP